jgi:dihydrolipoamide dehydrogenase
MMKSKDKAVTILTKGVEFLLKKNKVTYFKGLEVLNLKMKF